MSNTTHACGTASQPSCTCRDGFPYTDTEKPPSLLTTPPTRVPLLRHLPLSRPASSHLHRNHFPQRAHRNYPATLVHTRIQIPHASKMSGNCAGVLSTAKVASDCFPSLGTNRAKLCTLRARRGPLTLVYNDCTSRRGVAGNWQRRHNVSKPHSLPDIR